MAGIGSIGGSTKASQATNNASEQGKILGNNAQLSESGSIAVGKNANYLESGSYYIGKGGTLTLNAQQAAATPAAVPSLQSNQPPTPQIITIPSLPPVTAPTAADTSTAPQATTSSDASPAALFGGTFGLLLIAGVVLYFILRKR